VRELHAATGDAQLLAPVVRSMRGAEIKPLLPALLCALTGLPLKAVLTDAVCGADTLSPAELLVALHALDPAKDAVPLKRVMEAVALCFQQRAVYTPEVLGAVLHQLVEQSPLPLLLMRTVIQTAAAAPKLKPRILETLSKLVSKQVRGVICWKGGDLGE
jgi:symplekin